MIAALQAQPKRPGAPIKASLGQAEARPWDYETDAARRKLATGRKFVFGTNPDDHDVTGTVAMSRQEMSFKSGEIGSAQRFSQSSAKQPVQRDPEMLEKRQMLMGIVVLLFIVAALVYFLTSL